MDIASSTLLFAASGFWVRYGVLISLALVAWIKMPTALVRCTALGVCLAGLSASFVESEEVAMLILITGLTAGPFAGVVLDSFVTRERRRQSYIGRRYARNYVCSECENEFASVQRIGQCPRCERQFGESA